MVFLFNIVYSIVLDERVLADVRRIVCEPEYVPLDPKELCGRIFVTCYMGTENSSAETKAAASHLAEQIGRYGQSGIERK